MPTRSPPSASACPIEFAGAINTSSAEPDDPFIFLDLTATARMTDTLDVIVRPWFRRLPGGDWSKEMYQLQMRYQPSTAIPLRIDAGIISSPLGIIALEMRPDRNPIIGKPSYYFSPLPSFDGRFDRVQLLSGGYPLGAIVSLSGRRWDARAGVTDGTPARNRKMMSSARPPAAGADSSPAAASRRSTACASAPASRTASTASPARRPPRQRRRGPSGRHGLHPRRRVLDPLHADRRRMDPRQLRNGQRRPPSRAAALRSGAHAHAALVRRGANNPDVDAGVCRRHPHAADRRRTGSDRRLPPVAGDHAQGRISGLAYLHRVGLGPCGGGVVRGLKRWW